MIADDRGLAINRTSDATSSGKANRLSELGRLPILALFRFKKLDSKMQLPGFRSAIRAYFDIHDVGKNAVPNFFILTTSGTFHFNLLNGSIYRETTARIMPGLLTGSESVQPDGIERPCPGTRQWFAFGSEDKSQVVISSQVYIPTVELDQRPFSPNSGVK